MCIGDVYTYNNEYSTIYSDEKRWINKDHSSSSLAINYEHSKLDIDKIDYKAVPKEPIQIELIYTIIDENGDEIEFHGTAKNYIPEPYDHKPSLRIKDVTLVGIYYSDEQVATCIKTTHEWTGSFWTSGISTSPSGLGGSTIGSEQAEITIGYYDPKEKNPPTQMALEITDYISNSTIVSNPIHFTIQDGRIVGVSLIKFR